MASLESQALERLRANGTAQCGPALREWRQSGGKVLGLIYPYVPEEIATAAGMLPYRLRAFDSDSLALANECFRDINCTLVRHFYDEWKRGGFDFCDGFVTANACDHERRMFDNMKAEQPDTFLRIVNIPKKQGDAQADFFAKGLRSLVADIESAFGVSITEEKLRGAIDSHNRARALQRRMYELRKSENPPISGADMLAVMLAETSTPIAEYVALLEQLVADCETAQGISDYSARVVLYGGEVDDVRLVETIEAQGALVVGDYVGYGYRACRVDVPDTGDALRDLAEYYVNLRPEPRQFGSDTARQPLVESIVRDWRADGVIFPAITFCDYWTWEQLNFGLYAKEHGIALLNLQTEYVNQNEGQIATRVQAFCEAHGR